LKREKKNSTNEPDINSNNQEGGSSQGKEDGEKSGDGEEVGHNEGKPKGTSSDDETKKWTGGGFGPFRSQHNHHSNNNTRNDSEGGTGGNNLPPNFSSTMVTAILLLGMTYMMIRNDDETATPADFSTREITWNDFCNYLLETGQVEKIVVTNNRTMAKVFLKPGSPGLPQHQTRLFRYSDRRQHGSAGSDQLFQDSTQINDGSPASDGFGGAGRSSPLPHGKNQGHQHQIVYRFAM
jgi:hypothetical protein